jgi:hypothetical protein
MATENLLQSEILVKFVYPFLLIFFIVFAVLEKTKLFGEKKQANAMIAFVIGLIFVGALAPKLIVTNLILFLSVAIVIVFVVLILYGFAAGEKEGLEIKLTGLKWVIGIVVVVAVIVAIFLITGVFNEVIDNLFRSDWSNDLWTNVIFIVVIAAALAVVMKTAKKAA